VNIAYPRYQRLFEILTNLHKLFMMLSNSPVLKSTFYSEEIQKFCVKAAADMARVFIVDFTVSYENYSIISAESRAKFASLYEESKRLDCVKQYILLCNKIIPFREDIIKSNASFIINMAGDFCPFPFSTLNLKLLFIENTNPEIQHYFMLVLDKALTWTHNLYNEINQPDIDIEKFSQLIRDNIEAVKKLPELCRCTEAFAKITNSLDLLKTNFNSYYKDFITTQSPSIIMENFVIDVSKATTGSPSLTHEFRRIIQYYRKQANANIKDPRIKEMFKKLNDRYAEIDRHIISDPNVASQVKTCEIPIDDT
ncbi:MAG: hypothetical protein ACYCPT_12200, partial [Acidimicrobiales bacterium]